MSQLTKYGLKDASDAEDNESWFWDALLDLHDEAKELLSFGHEMYLSRP
jgi:hypothetical protein